MLNDPSLTKISRTASQSHSPHPNKCQKSDNTLSTYDHAESLCRFGLSERTLADLEKLPLRIQNWSRRIQSLNRYPAFQRLYGNTSSPGLQNIEWLASFSERPILEPSGFSLYAHTLHTSSGINKVYKKAKRRAHKFKTRMSSLDHYIDIDALPADIITLNCLQIVIGKQKSLPFSAKRRHARQTIDAALYEGHYINSDEVRDYLSDLCELYEDMVIFSQRDSLKRLLGPGFRGTRTSWTELKSYIKFSRAIRFASTSRAQACTLIENWSELGDDFRLASKKAASVHQELNKLARLNSGFLHATDSDNPDVETILQHAEIAETQIRQHLDFLSSEVDDNTLTPKTIVEMHIA